MALDYSILHTGQHYSYNMDRKILRKTLSLMVDFVRSSKFSYLSVFLFGVVLRGIPELLVSWYPVGYETITYYAPPLMTFHGRGLADVFADFFRAGPLFYVLMWFVRIVSGAHPYLILKVTGPLLYGGLAVSFLLFLKHGLRLDDKLALVATVLCIFQVATLRDSWDRFMVLLGLIFLFYTLTAFKSDHKFKWLLVATLASLTALSREYIASVLFVGVLGSAILEKKDRAASLVALASALAIFAAMNYPRQLWWSYEHALGGYLGVVQDVLLIFALCYLPLIPFVVRGFGRDRLLDPMLGWLLLGSFSPLVSPWMAVPGYQRWLMLLTFPFCIYAVKGFDRFHLFSKHRRKLLMSVVLIFMVIGIGYSTGTFSYVVLSNSWVPTSLVQSSIGWSQVNDTIACLGWLNDHAAINSSILAEERFFGWTLIYLERANDDVKVIAYRANSPPTLALEKASHGGFQQIYLIWYTDSSFEGFKVIYSRNDVSIFNASRRLLS